MNKGTLVIQFERTHQSERDFLLSMKKIYELGANVEVIIEGIEGRLGVLKGDNK